MQTYKITSNGREFRFDSARAAHAIADIIWQTTGVVVGVEVSDKPATHRMNGHFAEEIAA